MEGYNYYTIQEQKERYSQILKCFLGKKYEKLIKEASDFLQIEPNNLKVRFMRAKAFRFLGLFNEAISDLKYNINIEKNPHSLTELYFLYYHLNMYKEALELLPVMYEIKTIRPHSLIISELIMKQYLGIDTKVCEGLECDYIINQIKNYNLNEAIDHVKNHVDSKEDKSVFAEGLNVEYLVECIVNDINNSNKANIEEMLEVHYFLVPNIGYSIYNNKCDYVKVVVVPNTSNIITAYPEDVIPSNYNSNILKCDYNKLFNLTKKEKTMSRIDKFNKRYNR